MSNTPKLKVHRSKPARWGYCGLGLVSTSLGIVGAFLPVMPTTCFMLLAIWAFSKSSPRLHRWLWEHKTLGASLRRWQDHRCIPASAKLAAVLSMTGSMTYLVLLTDLGGRGLGAAGGFMALGAYFVLRAPSRPSGRPEDCARPEAALAMANAHKPSPPESFASEAKLR